MGTIPFRLEEITVVAGMVKDSFSRDISDFKNYSTKFNDPYLADLVAKIGNAEKKTNTKVYFGQLKTITINLYAGVDSLRPMLAKLEGYIKLAKSELSIAPKDFGIKEIRDKLRTKDIEAILDRLSTTLKHVDDNMSPLEHKGFKAAARAEFETVRIRIHDQNLEQNLKMDEKEAAVQANLGLLTELWNIIAELMDIGKRIYKYTDAEKTKDYTATSIKKRIRHETTVKVPATPPVETGILSMIIKSKSDGSILPGATVEIVGTLEMLEADENGECYTDSLKKGSYTLKVKMDGYKEVIVQNVVIATDETTELIIELEPATPAE